MNQIIKQYIELGRVLNVKYEDIAGAFQNRQQTVKVKAPEPQPVIAKPYAPTAEDALRLHEEHGNWATVAKLMGKRKADVIALVHSADPTPQGKARQPASAPAEGLTIKEATRKALSSKRYLTMREIVSAVRAQNICRPAYSSTVDMHVHTLARAGQVKVHKEIGKLTGYKLVGG